MGVSKVAVSKIEKLIKFCPSCGSKKDKNFIEWLSNGGAWMCKDCGEKVEAYVLSK